MASINISSIYDLGPKPNGLRLTSASPSVNIYIYISTLTSGERLILEIQQSSGIRIERCQPGADKFVEISSNQKASVAIQTIQIEL